MPADESRSQSSTATEETCPICEGTCENDDGTTCGSCSGSGSIPVEYGRGHETYVEHMADWEHPFRGKK